MKQVKKVSIYYSNEFLLKIETGLSLECDMSLFFSGSHKCFKYLTKTCESHKPKYIFELTLVLDLRGQLFFNPGVQYSK